MTDTLPPIPVGCALTGRLSDEELKQLSNAELEQLADRISAEIDRRWRGREKQAVKDAMNTEPKT